MNLQSVTNLLDSICLMCLHDEIYERLKEEHQESIDLQRVTLQAERKKKLDLWLEIMTNVKSDGTPYRIEDEE